MFYFAVRLIIFSQLNAMSYSSLPFLHFPLVSENRRDIRQVAGGMMNKKQEMKLTTAEPENLQTS